MSSGGASHRAKAHSISGWTDFDLNQRRKQQGAADNHDSNPYPSLSALTAPRKNESLLAKPFSSVLAPSIAFPSLKDVKSSNFPATTSTAETAATAKLAYGKLKDHHPWTDESLIQDVLAGVNDNVDEALSLLEAMVITDHHQVDKKEEVESSCNNFDSAAGNHKQSVDEGSSLQLLDIIKSLPVEPEPEWGEDDVYLIYRKDAIRMMRSASRHSKSANDAYLRGDHAAAHHFSVKAQQEWAAAERLNAKAAKEILDLRNCKSDPWTLDLHGLHAAEAVKALHEHLMTVETLLSPHCLEAHPGILKKSSVSVAASAQSSVQLEMEKFGRRHPTSRQRITLLQVITGKGNHSRGSAALPSAVRNFLSEKGYSFDETRPGVIMVRPKFRLR
ncbi:hypothetical protein SASPL_145194 [Salvia splendens]|uniref:Smr domain-containing protein n=1 Tax=Salvia splendens TaxID=180675 RepID=A0A8X8WG48_SALSN|nr:uncharacterized protein LOC121775201 [Salvia splendens]XP_042028169.1 uncharacterized protein LOC121775201 [Salvia splendens]KAG6394605.1 hypothetical protein SASPL_145194 [Salvia splendens]